MKTCLLYVLYREETSTGEVNLLKHYERHIPNNSAIYPHTCIYELCMMLQILCGYFLEHY
jgi:hypothetical protein